MKSICVGLILMLFSLGAEANSPTWFETECQKFIATKGHKSDEQRFNEFLKLYWKYQMTTYPEFATYAGEPGHNDQWTDMSLKAIETRKKELDCPVEAMASVQRSKLKDQLTFDLFVRQAQLNIEGRQFPDELLAVNQLGGVHQDLPNMLTQMPKENLKDYQNLLARLHRAPLLVDQQMLLLREGIKRKIQVPKVVLGEVPKQILDVIPDAVEKSPLYLPFGDIHIDISETEKEQLRAEAKKVISQEIYPSFKKLHDLMLNEYIPAAPEKIGWSNLPNGKAWYLHNSKMHTTTDLTPAEIHKLGLNEVERIHKEMEVAKDKAGFKGSLKEFSHFLNTDPQFFYNTGEELLTGYRDIAKRIDPELVRLFGKLPRNSYGVKAIPSFDEKSQTTAYYEPGSLKAGRPGYFMANTYDLKSRPKWEMVALTLHESVPGHHLQISLAQEMDNVPEFRKYNDNTAFIEGWGLYAESLGRDIGIYDNPYNDFGRLTYETWRACRLVIDTGIHDLGWTREQAINFMTENTAKTPHDIAVEVDRYIVWPGQALAYKIGELTFKQIRSEAKAKLGEKFDIRKFHDALLAEGPLPMNILQTRMSAWIESQTHKMK